LPGHFITDDVFLSAEDVVALLQVNLRTIYRMIKARRIPAVRVGRQWRFRKRDIESWLEGQRTMPASRRVPTAPSSSPPPQRVLVVDDESSIREMLSKTLARAEYKVDTAPDATAALNLLRVANTSYDLLIADLRMPGMNGLTMIRQVQQIRSGMPIIIITGFSSESSAIEAVNLGVKGYLTKPFRVAQVLAAAANAMGVSAA
jgi:excisionase family DNA binding protein